MAVNNLVNITIQAIDKVKEPLKSMTNSFTSFGSKIKGIGENLSGFSTKSGIAFAGLSYGLTKTLDASNDLQASLIGLESVVKGNGENFNKSKKFLESYTKDGLVSMSDSATSLKNLISRGFGLEEASQIMLRFKDSAAFGRQSSLELGEAIKGATEGIKNENSVLVDNAGVTKNVSMMWSEYADKLGKSVNDLTLAEKRQAEYNGILNETRFQVGDASKLSETFAGKQAILNAQLLQAKQHIGEALQPAMASLLTTITPVIQKVSEWITEHPKLTSNIIIGTTAVLGLGAVLAPLIITIGNLITVVGGLGTALMFLATNPIGLLVTAIAGLITIIALWIIHWDELKQTILIIAELIKRYAVEQFTQMKDSLLQLGSDIYNGFMGWIESMKTAMFEKVEAMMNYVKEKVEAAKKMLSNIAGTISSGVKSLGSVNIQAISGARATGGPVSSSGTYLVGEKGPELFTPSSSGYITPNNKLGLGNINLSINLGSVVVQNQADENRLIQRMKEELIRTIQLQKMGISI